MYTKLFYFLMGFILHIKLIQIIYCLTFIFTEFQVNFITLHVVLLPSTHFSFPSKRSLPSKPLFVTY